MKTLKAYAAKVADFVAQVWRSYPARSASYVAAAVVFVAAKCGVVVPTQSVLHAIEWVVPVLLTGEATHRNVKPAVK